MKKLMIAAAAVVAGASVYAASSSKLEAQVYDVNLTVKSTACKEIKYTKTIATLEGWNYSDVKGERLSVRKQGSTKIAGVIWGCECETIANPAWRTYNNGRTVGGYLFWNVGGETCFNIFTTTFKWAVFNRIDTGDKAEGVWALVNKDAYNTVGFLGAGFGKVSGTNCRTVLSSMSGNFAGFILAGSDASGCAFCGGTDCTAWYVCPCTPNGIYDLSLTAAYGSWKIKYNKSASTKLRRTGRITQSYNFKKAGDTALLFTKVELAALAGELSEEEDEEYDWADEDWQDEQGEEKEPAEIGAVAYAVGDEAGEPPAEYGDLEGQDSKLVEVILAIADAS